jgi:SAM-dependent methyltransferase
MSEQASSPLRQALRAIPGMRKLNQARVQFSIRLGNQLRHPSGLEVSADPCPNCGNQDRFAEEYRPYLYSPIRVCRCLNCGLRFLRPMPTSRFYERYYSEGYFQEVARRESHASDRLSKQTYQLYRARAERIYEFIRSAADLSLVRTVLEIGAAHGCNLERFRDGSPEVRLYEDELDRRWKAELEAKSIVNWRERPPSETADLVLLSHVLEHFRHPTDEVRSISRVMSVNGLLYVEVPHVPSGPAVSMPYKLAHTMYFSPETVRVAVESAGLSCLLMEANDDIIASLWRKS